MISSCQSRQEGTGRLRRGEMVARLERVGGREAALRPGAPACEFIRKGVGGDAALLIEFRALGALLSDRNRLAYEFVVKDEESFQEPSEDGIAPLSVCAQGRCI